MSLVKCDDCGKEVSDTASVCPGCGRELRVLIEEGADCYNCGYQDNCPKMKGNYERLSHKIGKCCLRYFLSRLFSDNIY